MNKLSVASIASVFVLVIAVIAGPASAVSIANREKAPVKVEYAEGAETKTVEIPAGEEVDVCEDGCKLTFAGKSIEVKGEESLEIVGGVLQAVKLK